MLIRRSTDSESCPGGARRLSTISGAAPTTNPATSSAPAQPASSRRSTQASSRPATARYGTISQSDQTATPASKPAAPAASRRAPIRRSASPSAISSISATAGFTSGRPPTTVNWSRTTRSGPSASSPTTSTAHHGEQIRRVSRYISHAKIAQSASIGSRSTGQLGPATATSGAARYASSMPM